MEGLPRHVPGSPVSPDNINERFSAGVFGQRVRWRPSQEFPGTMDVCRPRKSWATFRAVDRGWDRQLGGRFCRGIRAARGQWVLPSQTREKEQTGLGGSGPVSGGPEAWGQAWSAAVHHFTRMWNQSS